jgi:hypothetical protein
MSEKTKEKAEIERVDRFEGVGPPQIAYSNWLKSFFNELP